MIEPYGVVGLIPTVWGIRSRQDITRNLDHIEELAAGALWLSSLDVPVKLLVIPEGALQGFNDEALDLAPEEFIRTGAIDIPGPETDRLSKLAVQHRVFIIAQAKARNPDWPGLFFNVGFIIDPSGQIILKHHKVSALLPCERSASPHDLFDAWVKKYGRNLQSFWPVVDTAIGRLGVMMAMEGNYPENGRGLALNGAEVVYRASMPTPFTENDIFEISNRARALENNMYVLAPNIGGIYTFPETQAPVDAGGGRSMIVNYKGQIIGKQNDTNGSTFVTGTIDIEALRHHRASAQVTNWVKDIRSELAQIIYEEPLYPKNIYLDSPQRKHHEYKKEILDKRIQDMIDRGIWVPSSYRR
ncbi:nitrilase-related carbon-nitrogen hydrolase [Burkholderia sp. MSMB1826]|uniref:nitrilase-related carbon-nitrogen hydrolase n=1 Tax=Burkholderia sp. MSMB1826 TaxID=1637875 RepID=UPI0009EA1A50|nr:nitrilase-related carbon-nitrogen hydrolase [Burkholderia sp. MSMB1826]